MSKRTTRRKAAEPATAEQPKTPLETQLINGIQWHHRDDGELPPFNAWVMVFWWSPTQEYTEWAVGSRRNEPGGGWTWKLPKQAAENFEYWAIVPDFPSSRKPKPPPRKPLRIRSLGDPDVIDLIIDEERQ